MDYQLAERVLLESFELGCFNHLSFTGGEALLYVQDVLKLSRLASAKSYSISVVTNAFWAATDEKATTFVELLKDAGMSTLKISVSPFHERFVPVQNIANALGACERSELPAYVIFTGVDNEDLPSQFDAIRDRFRSALWLSYSVEPAGRARHLIVRRAAGDLLDAQLVCPDTSRLVVDYDGKVYPCCSVHGFFSELQLGSVVTESLSALVDSLSHNPLHRVIRSVGFSPILEALGLGQRDVVPSGAMSVCQLCRALLSGPHKNRAWKAAVSLAGEENELQPASN